MINISCIDVNLPNKIRKRKIYQYIGRLVQNESFNIKNIQIYFCSDSYLLKINHNHLNHNYFTDIITFDYSQNKLLEIELYISLDRIKENAKCYQVNFFQELHRVIFHGILHCVGYNDKTKTDKVEMNSKENEYLRLFCE